VQSTGALTRRHRSQYHDDGFVCPPGFARPVVCKRILDRVVEIARAHAARNEGVPGLVLPEADLAGTSGDR
jgi:hypothetical protein